MLFKNRKTYLPIFFLSLILLLASCNVEPEPGAQRMPGTLHLEITDAPIDDPAIDGVYVTIKDVRIFGKSWSGFEGKKTVNLLALQNGQTLNLGSGDLDAGVYSGLEIDLDNTTDEEGEAPGSYVLLKSGVKIPLDKEAEITIPARQNFETFENATTTVVFDFNLRKSIQYASANKPDFEFVSDHSLETVARVIEKDNAGSISGNLTDNISEAEKVIVYAYPRGGFDESEAMEGVGPSSILFKNAVTSSIVDKNGTYHLAYLEPGAYDLVFIAYDDRDFDGRLTVTSGLISKASATKGILTPVTLENGQNKKLDFEVNNTLSLIREE